MANKEANYDKVLLTLAALLALGTAGYLYTLKTSFAEKLVQQKSTPKQDFGEIPTEKVADSIQRLQQAFVWKMPILDNKPVPLNKSITIVLKDGELFDLYTEKTPLRPPMTNAYLRDNDLEFLSPNVADLDPDGDGFSNLEEFTKNTKPRDAQSLPPLTDKLFFKERVQENYIVSLQSSEMPIQVKRTEPVAPSVFIDVIPKDFGFDRNAPPRFTAEKYERKTATVNGIPKDVSELTVLDKSTGDRFVLVLREPKNLAAFEAVLEFRLTGEVKTYKVQKGGTFRITGIASTFKVLDVTETSATLTELNEKNEPKTPFVVNPRP